MYAQKSVTSPLTSSTCCAPETNTTTNQPPFNVKRKLLMFIIYLAPPGLSCGMWDLVPWPGIELRPPAEGDQCLSHWTTRDIPKINLKKKNRLFFHPPTLQSVSLNLPVSTVWALRLQRWIQAPASRASWPLPPQHLLPGASPPLLLLAHSLPWLSAEQLFLFPPAS